MNQARLGGPAEVCDDSGAISPAGTIPMVSSFVIFEAQGEQTEAVSFDVAEKNATDDASRIIVAGNPYKASGRFFDIHSRDSWSKIRISSFDHPNIREGKVVIAGGPSPSWPAEMEAEYGADSAFYLGRVLAEFPTVGSIDAIFER
jgi:hypothetical protein